MLFGHEVEDFEIGVTGICKVVGDMCGDVHRQTSFQGDLLAADFPNTFSANDIEELLGTVQVQLRPATPGSATTGSTPSGKDQTETRPRFQWLFVP